MGSTIYSDMGICKAGFEKNFAGYAWVSETIPDIAA
jgi:hypothetical protein